jgi:hypothetical protein
MSNGRLCSQIQTPIRSISKGGELKRTITIATAIALLVGAAAALAATANLYTTSFAFSKGAGSAKSPKPISYSLTYTAVNSDNTKAAAVLKEIDTKIYGLTVAKKGFPTCSAKQIETKPKFNGNCPKGSEIASGRVNSLLGDPSLTKVSRIACNPYLAIYNGGNNTQWYFFYTKTANDCAGLTTGSTAPYEGFVSRQGKYLVTKVPLPPDISTQVAGKHNFYGSLIKESLTYPKIVVKGKALTNSVGCLKGKRPYSVTFTSTDGTKTVSGSAKC